LLLLKSKEKQRSKQMETLTLEQIFDQTHEEPIENLADDFSCLDEAFEEAEPTEDDGFIWFDD
jgi:hypothetical protein